MKENNEKSPLSYLQIRTFYETIKKRKKSGFFIWEDGSDLWKELTEKQKEEAIKYSNKHCKECNAVLNKENCEYGLDRDTREVILYTFQQEGMCRRCYHFWKRLHDETVTFQILTLFLAILSLYLFLELVL